MKKEFFNENELREFACIFADLDYAKASVNILYSWRIAEATGNIDDAFEWQLDQIQKYLKDD